MGLRTIRDANSPLHQLSDHAPEALLATSIPRFIVISPAGTAEAG